MEGVLHRGAVPWGEALEPAFVVGLALQLPFALAGYLVARLLLRVSDGLRFMFERRRVSLPLAPPRILAPAARDDRRRAPRRGSAHYGRAPPSRLLASG